MLLILLLPGITYAKDDLDFSPGRPGFGDATSTPGRGRFLAQLGAQGTLTTNGVASVGTSSWMLRTGLDDGLEVRLRAPDLTLDDKGWAAGTVGLGALIGGELSERWSCSVIPEVSIDPGTGILGASITGTVAASFGPVGAWASTTASGADGAISAVAGGGLAYGGSVGIYANGWHTFGAFPFAGLGGWWQPSDHVQLDAGLDVGFATHELIFAPGVGVSFGL